MSPSDGIALTSLVVAALATYLTYRTGREAREDAHALARETREAQAEEARAARLHEARKTVYVEVLEYGYLTLDTVERTEPFMSWEGAPGPPEWPSDDELRRQSARTAAFGSPQVRNKLLELKDAVRQFRSAVFMRQAERMPGAHPQDVGTFQKLDEARARVRALVEEVIELANEELTR